jgi:hypothetical protein
MHAISSLPRISWNLPNCLRRCHTDERSGPSSSPAARISSAAAGSEKNLTRASDIAEDLGAILKVNEALNLLSVPVIAAIEGQAFGFSFGFTAQSDCAIAAENAAFSLPEMSHGLRQLVVFSCLFQFICYKPVRKIGIARSFDDLA